MIILKDLKANKVIPFEITKFPDGTSQVWKIDPFVDLTSINRFKITWMFENESELFYILQLKYLLQTLTSQAQIYLSIPYMPYARQDKRIDNISTFANSIFNQVLFQNGFYKLFTVDVHSNQFNSNSYIEQEYCKVESLSPKSFHNEVIPKEAILCFPDMGAVTRYSDNRPGIYFEKKRNQETGVIEGLELKNLLNLDLAGQDIYMIDDLCDGGGTFIGCAQELKKYNPKSINLVITHGLFTKGLDVLYDAGIDKIFTTNSLLRNRPTMSNDKFFVYKIVDIEYNEDPNEERYKRKMV